MAPGEHPKSWYNLISMDDHHVAYTPFLSCLNQHLDIWWYLELSVLSWVRNHHLVVINDLDDSYWNMLKIPRWLTLGISIFFSRDPQPVRSSAAHGANAIRSSRLRAVRFGSWMASYGNRNALRAMYQKTCILLYTCPNTSTVTVYKSTMNGILRYIESIDVDWFVASICSVPSPVDMFFLYTTCL